MSEINTQYLEKCIAVLEKSYEKLKLTKEDTIDYELYRNSLVKGFEMTLEQNGKLLKKKLNPYFASKKPLICFPLRIFLDTHINILLYLRKKPKGG